MSEAAKMNREQWMEYMRKQLEDSMKSIKFEARPREEVVEELRRMTLTKLAAATDAYDRIYAADLRRIGLNVDSSTKHDNVTLCLRVPDDWWLPREAITVEAREVDEGTGEVEVTISSSEAWRTK